MGKGTPCWLVLPRKIDPSDPEQDPHLKAFKFSPAFNWHNDSDPDHVFESPVNAAEIVWNSDRFNDLIRLIANWHEISMLFVSRMTGSIIAPYDSGVDCFLPNSKAAS